MNRMASHIDHAKWNAGASPCTDDILSKERVFGGITEPAWEGVQYLTGCLPMMMFS